MRDTGVKKVEDIYGQWCESRHLKIEKSYAADNVSSVFFLVFEEYIVYPQIASTENRIFLRSDNLL